MVLKNLLKRGAFQSAKKTVPSGQPKPLGIKDLFVKPFPLPEEIENQLKTELEQGTSLFAEFNTSRLELAFQSFDQQMKQALFEIIFLLHVNEPFLENWKYKALEVVDYKEKEVEKTVNLYTEGAPSGVLGIEDLSEVFREEFTAYIQEVFDVKILQPKEESAIVGLFSIGSIGTIGHKTQASDLDLEVLYRLEPFNFDTKNLNDKQLKDLLVTEIRFWMKKFQKKERIGPEQMADPAVKAEIQKKGKAKVKRIYPILYRHLLTGQMLNVKKLIQQDNPTFRSQLVQEVVQLFKHHQRISGGSAHKQRETLLKERIHIIQEYVNHKFPEAELYLFPFSEVDMKKGRFSSTLESKESSGSAYELLLNYDTLMPGVYFTSSVPTHFIFKQDINNDPKTYDELLDNIRFNLLDRIYGDIKHKLMDQGSTPDLDIEYVARHQGALYWEAFKATSGNLPKALLNLFRYESFFEEDTGKTVIQLLKDSTLIDSYATEKPADGEISKMAQDLPCWMLIDLEEQFPRLRFDPWWLRYKALKISFNEQGNVVGIPKEELQEISGAIDLAFALHVRLSDIFTKAGSTKSFESHREQVLLEFYKHGFPPGTKRRKQVESIFIGEISEVNNFEHMMRDLFMNCVSRVREKVKESLDEEVKTNEEYDIWYHYYKENFEPKPQAVQRTILQHLMVPRGRVQIGLRGKSGWFFKSLQKGSSVGRRFDTFDILDQLPDQIVLFENIGFLSGLAHCIFNGYYGILNKGTLKETFTSLEFDGKHMDLGNEIDNQYAYIHPGQVERMMVQILKFFPLKKVDFRDCLYEERKIKELYIFLNLLNFGKLSFLFRDNLNTVFYEEDDNPELHENAATLNQGYQTLFGSGHLAKSIDHFLSEKKIDIRDVKLKVWVNTNSFETNHVASNVEQKERDLELEFFEAVMRHQLKNHPEDTTKSLKDIFDKEALSKALMCGVMLVKAGSNVTPQKYEVVKSFLNHSLKEQYGDAEVLYKQAIKEHDYFFISRAEEYKRVDAMIKDLNNLMTLYQKKALMKFLDDIMEQDDKPTTRKFDLHGRFKKYIQLY